MEVHVIRHTPVNFDKNRCYGQLDIPLAETFDEDVEKIKNQLANDYDIVFSSPQERCTNLTNALDISNKILDDRLLELNFGEWEGKLWNEINQDELNNWMEDFVKKSPTNGESLEHLFTRVSVFCDSLRNEKFDKVLIVTHSGVIRCMWAYLLEIPLKNIFKIPVNFHEHFRFKLNQNSQLDSIINLK